MGTQLWYNFPIRTDEKSVKWIKFDDFFDFIKKNQTECDKVKDIRRYNTLRTIKTYYPDSTHTVKVKKVGSDGLEYESEEVEISFIAFLRFCFVNYNDLRVCKRVVSEIEECALKEEEIDCESLYDFYKVVSKSTFRLQHLEKLVTHSTHLVEIPCLFERYNCFFSTEEWEKIKIFENYFWSTVAENPHFKQKGCFASSSVRKRRDLFNQCKLVHGLQPALLYSAKRTIKSNIERKACAAKADGKLLVARYKHIPLLLDKTVAKTLEEQFPGAFRQSVCLDCDHFCRNNHSSGIHVYLEAENVHNLPEFEEVCTLIKEAIATFHCENCTEISIFDHLTFEGFLSDESINKRFHLRDSIHAQTLSRRLFYTYADVDTISPSENTSCTTCGPAFEHNDPLNPKDLDLLREWKYHVPLPIQIILESFLNPNSIMRTGEKQKYLLERISKLHLLFDSLLNANNKHYLGIQQEINTDELSASYHSVTKVFSVTAQGGLTTTLKQATSRLQEQADVDTCYYNTFLKKFPLEYEAFDGEKVPVSLQDCHIIFCLDNLVRLSFHRDPDRGESRANQICTLPMTLMGIPRTSTIVKSWHDASICDGSEHCKCKDKVMIGPDDIDIVFHDSLGNEKTMKDKLRTVLTWGHYKLWEDINSSDLNTLVQTAVNATTTTSEENNIASSPYQKETNPNYDYDKALDGILMQIDKDEGLLGSSFSDLSSISEDDHFWQDTSSEDGNAEDLDEVNKSLSELSLGCIPLESNLEFSNVSSQFIDANKIASSTDKSAEVNAHNSNFGFKIFHPPPLLIRHPPPAIGKDDDKQKLAEILEEILTKSGNNSDTCRILFAPDNKIGRCLFQLMKENTRFNNYLPEFPLLHLRKSKIGNLCSAYKDAGLYHLLSYMEDTNTDWANLVSTENIEDATHSIRRLSYSLHLALVIKFLENLSPSDATDVFRSLQKQTSLDPKWNQMYDEFISKNSELNATFSLHIDMLVHCDEILAIALAERIGGEDGYDLLLSTVKSSLPFSFLNGSSAYGVFCCHLLLEHYSSGYFHQNFKKTFYTIPYKGSDTNFALDTHREMDHKDALKSFRPRASVSSVVPRMSLIDHYHELEKGGRNGQQRSSETSRSRTWGLSKQDIKYIYPTTAMILRQGGLASDSGAVPKNVYAKSAILLSSTILDKNSFDVGKYLIERYVLTKLFGSETTRALQHLANSENSKELIKKAKSAKSVTVRRTTCKPEFEEQDLKEEGRKKKLRKLMGIAECLSSEMNTCQAVVKADCSKSNIKKASTMKKALTNIIKTAIPNRDDKEVLDKDDVLSDVASFGLKTLPVQSLGKVSHCIVELAGVKFKTKAKSGYEYLKEIEETMINSLLRKLSHIRRIVLCEEKYSFTPDDFKAATRSKRQKKTNQSISHLKQSKEIISHTQLEKTAITGTELGKAIISSFLAGNVASLNIKKNLVLDVDSEWQTAGCDCEKQSTCNCKGKFAIPLRAIFAHDKPVITETLNSINQKKGEAEMAIADWLVDVKSELDSEDEVLLLVTSGDIDAVIIHLFVLSYLWPRQENRKFKHNVHVALLKPSGIDLYCISKIVEILETKYGLLAGMKISLGLCVGGNDFIPKFIGISHDKILKIFVENQTFFNELFTLDVDQGNGSVNHDIYKLMTKHLYCPTALDPQKLSLEEVRQLTIKHPKKKEISKPTQWMPPASALDRLCELVEYQLQYLFTAGRHSAPLPDFLEKGCLFQQRDGSIRYFLGEETNTDKPESLLKIPEATLLKRVMECTIQGSSQRKRTLKDTPQKGARRKKKITSTPKK